MKKLTRKVSKVLGRSSTTSIGSGPSVGGEGAHGSRLSLTGSLSAYDVREKDMGKVHKAAWTGDMKKLQQALKKGDINALDKENRTPLHLACARGNVETVQFLCENNAKLNVCDDDMRSPLMKAVQSQFDECTAILLEHEADTNLVDKDGNTALHLSALIPSLPAAEALLNHDARIDTQNKSGSTPLHLATYQGYDDFCEFLLKEGTNIDAQDNKQRTPLMLAGMLGHVGLVKLLLENNADTNIRDNRGWTAEDCASTAGQHAAAHLIVDHSLKTSRGRGATGRKSHSPSMFNPPSPSNVDPLGFAIGGPAGDEMDESPEAEDLRHERRRLSFETDRGKKGRKTNESQNITKDSPKRRELDAKGRRQSDDKHKRVRFSSSDSDEDLQNSEKKRRRQVRSAPKLEEAKTNEKPSSKGKMALAGQAVVSKRSRESVRRKENLKETVSTQSESGIKQKPGGIPSSDVCRLVFVSEASSGLSESSPEQGANAGRQEEADVYSLTTVTDVEVKLSSDTSPFSDVGQGKGQRAEATESKVSCEVSRDVGTQVPLPSAEARPTSETVKDDDHPYEEVPYRRDSPQSRSDAEDSWAASEPSAAEPKPAQKPKSVPKLTRYLSRSDESLPEERESGSQRGRGRESRSPRTPRDGGDSWAASDGDRSPSPAADSWGPSEPESIGEKKPQGKKMNLAKLLKLDKDDKSQKSDGKDGSPASPRDKLSPRARGSPPLTPTPRDRQGSDSQWDTTPPATPTPRQNGRDRKDDYEDVIPTGKSKSTPQAKAKAPVTPDLPEDEEDRKRVLAELGLSDVSEVSSVNFDTENETDQDAPSPLTPRNRPSPRSAPKVNQTVSLPEMGRAQQNAEKKETPRRSESQEESDSDWDSDEVLPPSDYSAGKAAGKSPSAPAVMQKRPPSAQESEQDTSTFGDDEVIRPDEEDFTQSVSKTPSLQESGHRALYRGVSQTIEEEDEDQASQLGSARSRQSEVTEEESESEWEREKKRERQERQKREQEERERAEEERRRQQEKERQEREERERREIEERERREREERERREREERERREQEEKERQAEKKRKEEEEARRKEKQRKEEEERRKEEERQHREEKRRKEEEKQHREEEKRRKELERQEEERRQKEEELRQARERKEREEQKRREEEERKSQERRRREQEEKERFRKEEERRLEEERQQQERKRKEEERKRRDELARQREEEELRLEQEQREKERRRREEEKERIRLGEERIRKEKADAKRKEEERRAQQRREEEERLAEEERKEEERRREREKEEERRQEEKRRQEEARRADERRIAEEKTQKHLEKLRQLAEKQAEPVHDSPRLQSSSGGLQRSGSIDKEEVFSSQSSVVEDEIEEDARSLELRRTRERAEQELAEAKQVRRERMLSAGSGSFSLSEDDFDGHLGRGRPTSRRSGTTAVNGGSSRHHGDYTGVDADLDLSVSTDTEMEDVVDQSPLANMRITSQSPLNDSSTLLKLNQRLQEVSRQLEREKAGREEGQVKVRSLESERNDLKRRLDTANREKSNLDTIKIDLEGEIRKLKYQLGEEQERRKTADTVLNKTKEQLAKKETQYSQEVENKQKSELTIRGLQIELRSTQSQVKALEEERDEARRLLSAEKQARQSQEEHHNEQMQQLKNEEISKLSVDRQSEALNKLESADDTRRSVSDHNEKLKSELMHLKIELERQRTRYRDEYGLLHSENEELNNKIEELKNEINRVKVARRTEKRMSEEALAHSHAMFNNQLAQVKSQNAVLTADLDKERSQKDRLTAELDSLKQRLQSASQELEKGHLARNELERASQHERDELKRAIDHKEAELSALRENKRGLGQQLGTAESRIKGLEHEIQMTQASLNEKNNQLNNLQRDLDQRRGNLETLEQRVLQERDNSTKLKAKLETANEKIAGLQNESLLLKQQAEESKFGGRPGSRGAGGEQDRLQGMLDRMKDENQRLKDSLEEKNKSLTDTVNMMREEMRSQDMNRSSSNMEYQRMQQELSDAMKKVSLAEAALEGVKKAKDSLEIEKNALQGEIERLKSKVMGLEEQRHDSQTKIRELQDHAKEMERHSVDPQRKAELETSVQKLQMEKAQLDATLKHEQTRAEMMQKDLEDSHKVRSSLEALVANLKTSNVHLEDKLSEEAANRSLFARDAEDSRALWESEVKSRSKLGLRIAQLEREKAEAHTGVDEEKRRIKRMAELKKMAEEKMHEEMQRNTRLQEDLATARMQLRGAKKKLKEFMSGDWGQERKALQGTIETLRKQVGEVRGQLEQEEQMRAKADMLNRQLQNDMTSYKTMEKEVQRFEKLKEQIEDEFIKYKQHVDSNFVDKSYIDNYKKQLEAQSRTELNSKLQQVNEYLEGQAQARNKLDKLRDSNDEKIRSEYEQSMNGLKGELARLRSSLNDSLTQRETVIAEKDRFMEKYNEAIKKAERLNSQLEKERERNTESVTKLTVERQKLQDVSSGLLNTSMGGTLHISSLMNNSADGEDALTRKVRQELDRSIAHHMSRPPTSLGPSRSRRESPMKDNDSAYLNSLRRNYFV